MARADELIVNAHQQRDGDGAEDRERAPRAADQRLDDDESQNRKHDDADQENADARNRARNRPHLGTHDIAERTAVAPRRQKKDGHVLDRTGKYRAGENPQRTGQITHLRGKHRTNQRTRACNGREVMPEEHVFIGWNVIETVVMAMGGGWPRRFNTERPLGDEQPVEPVGYEIDAHRRDHQPRGIDRLAPMQRNNPKRHRAEQSDCRP